MSALNGPDDVLGTLNVVQEPAMRFLPVNMLTLPVRRRPCHVLIHRGGAGGYWDVNEAIQAIVRGGRAVDVGQLADPNVPLEAFG